MATRSYTSRTEFAQYRFSPVVLVLVPFALIALQVLLPRVWAPLLILDLPLIAVIFFSVSSRRPIFGASIGAAIGLVQDALTGQPLGISGITKTLIGYAASSIGLQVDVENVLTRLLMAFVFSLLESALMFLIEHYMLGQTGYRFLWVHELIRAAVNTAVALPLFALLDGTKRRD